MKYITGDPARVELTRHNLETLLAKLDDPSSRRTLMKQEEFGVGNGTVMVVAVENEAHYADRAPGPVSVPRASSTRSTPVMTNQLPDVTLDQAIALLIDIGVAVGDVLGPDYEPQGLAADLAAALHSRSVEGRAEGHADAMRLIDGQLEQAQRYGADNVCNALARARTAVNDMRARVLATWQEN